MALLEVQNLSLEFAGKIQIRRPVLRCLGIGDVCGNDLVSAP